MMVARLHHKCSRNLNRPKGGGGGGGVHGQQLCTLQACGTSCFHQPQDVALYTSSILTLHQPSMAIMKICLVHKGMQSSSTVESTAPLHHSVLHRAAPVLDFRSTS